MKGSIKENFANQPTAVLKETKEILGVVFVYNGHTASAWMSVAALLITGVVFYLLAVLVLIRKKNEMQTHQNSWRVCFSFTQNQSYPAYAHD